jgi:hypothetical protein
VRPAGTQCRRVEPSRKERKQQPTSRVVSHGRNDAVQDGRPPSYLSAGRTEEREGPCHTAWVSGSVTSPRRRFLEKIHEFSLSFARPKHVTGDEATARARVPNRTGAGRRCRPGSAMQSVCSGSAGRAVTPRVTSRGAGG